MKNAIKIAIAVLSVLLITTVIFYLWATQSNLTSEHHQVLRIDHDAHGDEASNNGDLRSFSVMTYNIGYLSGMTNNRALHREDSLFKENMERAKALLDSLRPDIIGFQEIDYGSRRSYCTDQEQALAYERYPYAARAVNWDKKYVPFPYGWPSLHFGKILSGQSVLSQYPITEQQADTLSPVLSAPFYYRAFYLERLAQVVHMNVSGNDVIVINVHLEAFDTETRKIHTEHTLQLFKQYSGIYPTILMGDFNSSPGEEDAAIQLLLDDDLIGAADLDTAGTYGYTFDSRQPSKRLDYIFYSKQHFELLEGRVVMEAGEISDHLPVWARFQFVH